MGCRQSSTLIEDDGRAGGGGREGGGGEEDALAFTNAAMDAKFQELKETLGLTRRQLFTLDKSWKAVQRKLTATGVEMFILSEWKEINTRGDLW
ncbi:hypothetical protein ACOMHN_013167 [Nucella lapillus]